MDQSELLSSKQAIEKSYGPWTAHNFSLGQDVFTIANKITGDEVKLRRVLQVVADVCNSPIDQLRVLDLACLEGMYAIEFARKGARVCAIEGREANLEKARFAARALSLDAVEFFQDDVRNLTEEKYGKFDVVLCLGILYHLDAPDLFDFLERVYSVSRRVVVIDTHVSLHPEHALSYRGRAYWGATVPEHTPDSSLEERRDALWASLDNLDSFYFTAPSLCSLLSDLGFTSVYECQVPQEPLKPKDRTTLVAIKGTLLASSGCPQLPADYARELPERSTLATAFSGPAIRHRLRRAKKNLPAGLNRFIRRLAP